MTWQYLQKIRTVIIADSFIIRITEYIEYTHHWSNGTVKTVTDLTGTDIFTDDYRDIINKLCATPYITEIIPKMLNY